MNAEVDSGAQRAFEVAVQVVRVEHAAVRSAGRVFVRAVELTGRSGLGPRGLELVRSYDDFARALASTFHELEEEVVDRIQVLHAQGRLVPGALAPALPRFMQLERELLALGLELDELAVQFAQVPDALAAPLAVFAAAVRACVATHRNELVPAVAPYFGGNAWPV